MNDAKPKPTPEERKAKREERKRFLAEEAEKQRELNAKRAAEWAAEAEKKRAEEVAAREERLKPKTLRIVNRGLVDVLAWMPHHRGRNWVAFVEVEPTLPGGVKRTFFPRASGKVAKVVVPESLEVGDLLEFGADYVSFGGKRSPTRVYAVVTALSETELSVKPYDDLAEAQEHGKSPEVRVRIA